MMLFTFLRKTSNLNKELYGTEPSPSVSFPCFIQQFKKPTTISEKTSYDHLKILLYQQVLYLPANHYFLASTISLFTAPIYVFLK